MEKLLNVREAAEMLRLGRPTLYKYAMQRIIPTIKLGARLLFDEGDLQAWVEAHKRKPPGAARKRERAG